MLETVERRPGRQSKVPPALRTSCGFSHIAIEVLPFCSSPVPLASNPANTAIVLKLCCRRREAFLHHFVIFFLDVKIAYPSSHFMMLVRILIEVSAGDFSRPECLGR